MTYDGARVVRIARDQVGATQGANFCTDLGFSASGDVGDLWCSVFVSWVMRESGFGALYPVTASTQKSYSDYRAPSRLWIVPVADGQAGDIAWMRFDDPDRTPAEVPVNHIGIVAGKFSNSRMPIVDGNSMNNGVEGVWEHGYTIRQPGGEGVVAVGRPGGRGAVDGPEPIAYPGQSVKPGAHGPAVEYVQRNLNRFLPTDIPVNGRFDNLTKDRLTKWQRNRLIPEASLGHVGEGTWSMLAAPVFSGALEQGSSGKAVQQLKQALNRLGNELDTNNSDFGPKTFDVVRTWQSNRSQEDDGIVDMLTWYWMHIPKKPGEIDFPNLHPRR
jgi:hypothetical protein